MSRGRGGGGSLRGRFRGPEVVNALREPKERFPPMELPARRQPNSQEQECLKFYRAYLTTLKDSPFYLDLPPPPKAIERYSDKYLQNNQQKSRGGLAANKLDIGFFPDELYSVVDRKKAQGGALLKKRRNIKVDLSALDGIEHDSDPENEEGKVAGVEDDELEDFEEEEEDEEAGHDYNETYFNNGEDDDVEDDDGDGEATF
ncbi:hypothetical protein IWQ61_005675 [Dispira simplex]|nr:hypothetical protein IWQ61_005675 [Dispira simplex]